jgi:hypothetical protein
MNGSNPFQNRDPLIEHYKQFVNRRELRANLNLSVDERLQRLHERAAALPPKNPPPSPDKPWEPVCDCGPNRTADPVIELYKRDVDRTLLRENLRRTADERLQKLDDFMRFVRELRAGAKRLRTLS